MSSPRNNFTLQNTDTRDNNRVGVAAPNANAAGAACGRSKSRRSPNTTAVSAAVPPSNGNTNNIIAGKKVRTKHSMQKRTSSNNNHDRPVSNSHDDPLIHGISFANLVLDDDDSLSDKTQDTAPVTGGNCNISLPTRSIDTTIELPTQMTSPASTNAIVVPDPTIARTHDPIISLPIDRHRDEILRSVQKQRVTIIHGETGCGKSSRVPCFLLRAPPPDHATTSFSSSKKKKKKKKETAPEVKMVVSQPRRIAAKALAERVRSCEPDLADKIGLRMGHGVREYDSPKTRAWFVTTGYLVRKLANHPGWFQSHTHLIIDEVHERSIDTDILCLLCRRLLYRHPTIRLVLMSATMAAELYGQYFGVPSPPIFVGARRFPIKEIFVEDLISSTVLISAPSRSKIFAKLAKDVHDECERSKCKVAPTSTNMANMYKLATEITASVGNHGSSVLIFVPGMSDIISIIELIEKLVIPGVSFLCLPIHSDVPFEEQLAVFDAPQVGEVKVIIATNAAESSLTLPDCDHVICLGLCKQIIYDSASHRQMLVPTWISKASATQRAGRTGRVREGYVYRLYSRKAFEQYMEPFEKGEIARSPLDSTILSLRDMLNEPVTPILLECLEPPDISTIERSFQSLYESHLISHPSDEGVITSKGSLVAALGIDLMLGSLVGRGIQFGVAAEATQLAAILSFPQTPWAVSNPIYHDNDTFNAITSKTFISRCYYDSGLLSEPLAIINLLHDYSHCEDRNRFIRENCLAGTRMRHLYGTVQSLKQRVAEHLRIDSEQLEIESLPLNHSKVNILRIIQVWTFYNTIIVQDLSKRVSKSFDKVFSISLSGPLLGRKHLSQILDDQRHKYEITSVGKICMQGRFQRNADFSENAFDIRFASHSLEKKIEMSVYFRKSTLKYFILEDVWKIAEDTVSSGSEFFTSVDEIILQQLSGGNKRGIRGRACGAWQLPFTDCAFDGFDRHLQMKRVFILSFLISDSKDRKKIEDFVQNRCLAEPARSCLFCSISESKNKTSFTLTCEGECHSVSKTDLSDMFAAPDVHVGTSGLIQQCVTFPLARNHGGQDYHASSHPLIQDAPEGARLMSVISSLRRKEKFIRFNDGKDKNNGSTTQFIDAILPKNMSINGSKWKKKNGHGTVYVQENCVPAAALPFENDLELFGCCANTLELRGGACRVEGITLLPQGRMFIGLAMLAFGVNPRTGSRLNIGSIDSGENDANSELFDEEVDAIIDDAHGWIKEKDPFSDLNGRRRISRALQFHTECLSLDEALECRPDKIKSLCALFDMVDGHPMPDWNVKTSTVAYCAETEVAGTHVASTHPTEENKRNSIIPAKLITSRKKRWKEKKT